MSSSVPLFPPRSPLRQLSPVQMLDTVRFRGFASEEQLQAAIRAFNRARGHATGLDCRRFRDTLIREASAGMPLEMAERVFAAWNQSATGELSLDEFLAGVALATNGPRDDHLRFVFDLIKNGQARNKIGRDDTAAFLRYFGTPSTIIATFKATPRSTDEGPNAAAQISAKTSFSIAEFCSSIHPSPTSTLALDEFIRLFNRDEWQNVETLVFVDWLRGIGDRISSGIAIDQSGGRESVPSSSQTPGSLAPAQFTVYEPLVERRYSFFQPWVFSRHEREAIRRELDDWLSASNDGSDIKCNPSESIESTISESYRRATKDSELVQAIYEWIKYVDASRNVSTTCSRSTDGKQPRPWREQHKKVVLGLCCAQSCSTLQVYRSLFALFDEDNRGRLTESNLADFFFVMTPHYDREDSERAAYDAMASSSQVPSSPPPPSPRHDYRSKRASSRTIMTFMQFVDLAQQQNGLSAPEIEMVLLLFNLVALGVASAPDQSFDSVYSLPLLLRDFRDATATNTANNVYDIQSSGFYLCEESKWRRMVEQICKLSDCTWRATASSHCCENARELAQILNGEADSVTSMHVVIPLPVWVMITFWVANRQSSNKPSLDWRTWATSTEMIQNVCAPPAHRVSVSLSSSTAELAWNRSVHLPHAVVSSKCNIRAIVDAACTIAGWSGTKKHTAASTCHEANGTSQRIHACALAWLGIDTGGLQIPTDLLEMPLSALIQNLPPHGEQTDEVPTLVLKVTLPDVIPTSEGATLDEVLLNERVSSSKRAEAWTTLRGLTNLGNTCFMNSALQSLIATPLLREYIQHGEYQLDQAPSKPHPHKHLLSLKREACSPSLTEVFSQLLREMKSLSLAAEKGPTSAVTPIKMYSTLGALFPHMCDGSQQDAQEFISSFVSKLSEELKRGPDICHDEPEESVLSPQSRAILSQISTGQDVFPGSPTSGVASHALPKICPRDSDGRHDRIVAMEWWVSHLINEPSVITCFFSGQFKSVLTCSACGKKSTRFEPFSSLQLPIANQERETANALDVTAIVHFADSPRLCRPRRLVISATNAWTIQDLLHKIAQDYCTKQPQFILAAVVIHGALIQDVYDEDMLLVAVPMPIHVLELDSSVDISIATISAGVDPYGSVLMPRSDPSLGDDVLVKMSTDRLVKGVVTAAHSHAQASPRSFDVLLTEGMANGRTVRHVRDVETKSAAQSRAVYLRCIHRHNVLAPFYCTTPRRRVVGGTPFMIRVAAGSLTGFTLYNILTRRFFGRAAGGSPRRSSRTSSATRWRFALRRVCDDGKTCGRCHWMHNCSGCLIDDRGSELLGLSMDETIAIDWVDEEDADPRHHRESNSREAKAPYEPEPVEDDESYRSYRAQHSRSIADSLAMLCSEETLEARCSACQRQQQQQQQQPPRAPFTLHTKQLSIWSVPPVLVLQLKRFELSVSALGDCSWQKLSDRVDFPVRGLELSPFLSAVDGAHGDDAACSPRCTEVLDARVLRGMAFLQDELGLPLDSASRSCAAYDLYAVINHSGELNSGHYTAVVRHAEDAASDTWWFADDAAVSRADRALLAPSATAYVLFYVRRDVATSAGDLVGDLVGASLGTDAARGARSRRPREFFPRRPARDAEPPEPPRQRARRDGDHAKCAVM